MGVLPHFLNVSVFCVLGCALGYLYISVTHFARNWDQIGAKTGPKIDQNWSKIEPSRGQVGVWTGGCTSDMFFTPNLPLLVTEKLIPGANLGPVKNQVGPQN